MFQQIIYLLAQVAVPVAGIGIVSACFVSLFSMRPAGRPKAVLIDNASGEKIVINMYETSLGRSKSSDIVVVNGLASRSHAVISRRKKGWFISDTNSKSGTFVNSQRIEKRTQIFDGDIINIANSEYTFIAPHAEREAQDGTKIYKPTSKAAHKESMQCAVVDNKTGKVYSIRNLELLIGRSNGNDIVIDDPHVSRFHAEVKHTDEGWAVIDRGSTAGTGLNGYRVNDKEPLSDGDVIQVLTHSFTFKESKGGRRNG